MKKSPFLSKNNKNFSVYTASTMVTLLSCLFVLYHLLGIVNKNLKIEVDSQLLAIKSLSLIKSPVNGVVRKIYLSDSRQVEKDEKLMDVALDEDTWYLYFRGNENIKRLQAKLLHLKERLKGEKIPVTEEFKRYLGSFYNFEMMTKLYKSDEMAHVQEELEKRVAELELLIQNEKKKIKLTESLIDKEKKRKKEIEPAVYAGAVEVSVLEGIDKRILSAKRKIIAHNRLIDSYRQEINLKHQNKKENIDTLLVDIGKTQEKLYRLLYEMGINIEKMSDLSRVVTVRSPWSGKIGKQWVPEENRFVMAGDTLFSFAEERYKVRFTFDKSHLASATVKKSIDDVTQFYLLDDDKALAVEVEAIEEVNDKFSIEGYLGGNITAMDDDEPKLLRLSMEFSES